jgi:hypothetical protein
MPTIMAADGQGLMSINHLTYAGEESSLVLLGSPKGPTPASPAPLLAFA